MTQITLNQQSLVLLKSQLPNDIFYNKNKAQVIGVFGFIKEWSFQRQEGKKFGSLVPWTGFENVNVRLDIKEVSRSEELSLHKEKTDFLFQWVNRNACICRFIPLLHWQLKSPIRLTAYLDIV